MIISEDDVLLNLSVDNKSYFNLTLSKLEDILSSYKFSVKEVLEPKELVTIPNAYAYFCDDSNENKFKCMIYKTAYGSDRWIMLMKDDNEGYALYTNPSKNTKELAWYHSKLEEPLSSQEEKNLITCYVPSHK